MRYDYLRYVAGNLFHRKLRSWLTILSILIGIAAIYTLVSFGQGLSTYIDEFAVKFGKDKLIVQAKGIGAPGLDSTFSLTEDDLGFIRKINGVNEAAGAYMKSGEVSFNEQKKFVYVSGSAVGKERHLVEEAFTLQLEKGRELKQGDKFKAIAGYNYQLKEKIFSKPLGLGDKILLNGKTVEVVGFYKEVGNPQDDSNIYITQEGSEAIFGGKGVYQFFILRSAQGQNPAQLAEKVQERLRKFRDVPKGEETFFVQTFEQAVATFTTVIAVINGVLVLIALISLLVAGVNIMNTMYTAVLERTKEIGVMKAVGARQRDILLLFVMESGLLGLVGGVLGVVLGYGISTLGGRIASSAGYGILQPAFPLSLTVGCLLFAFFVGTISGLLPARQAAKLSPVEALRYE